jgi:hypothetical protein
VRPLRMITIAVLGVLALGGVAGGLALVTDPTGARLGLTVERLPAWPLLDDYLVPGIALIVLFGILPAVAAMLLVRRHRWGWTAAAGVGLLLVLWMGGQVYAIGLAFPALQVGFLLVGVGLTGLGLDGGASVGTTDEVRARLRS